MSASLSSDDSGRPLNFCDHSERGNSCSTTGSQKFKGFFYARDSMTVLQTISSRRTVRAWKQSGQQEIHALSDLTTWSVSSQSDCAGRTKWMWCRGDEYL